MDAQGVFVQVEYPEIGSAKGSGLQIKDIVIAHGTILAPLFADCINENLTQQYNSLMKLLADQQKFKNQGSKQVDCGLKFKVLVRKLIDMKISSSNINKSVDYELEEATLCLLFDYKNCSYITQEISHWTCNKNDSEYEGLNKEMGQLQLPEFIFLMIGDPDENKFKQILHQTYASVRDVLLYPGQPVVVESTPFGNYSFASSWSHGIISKLVGNDDDGFLTDARLVLGCEGAPIFTFNGKKKTSLIGQVIQTMSWCKGEWVGFSLALSVKHLLHALLELQSTIDYIPFNKLQIDLLPSQVNIDRLSSSILFVRCGHKAGSGVVVDANVGLVITCSHIVNHSPGSVKVQCAAGQFPASVVYASPPSTPYDLALLYVGKIPNLTELPLAESPPVLGERVITAGFPLVRESPTSPTPTLSAGCVAKVSGRGGPLHTTCVTQSGVSGGAMIRPPHHLLGIIVANLCLNGTTTMPAFSFAISVDNIRQPILRYLQTRDAACLQSLTVNNCAVKVEWALVDCKL